MKNTTSILLIACAVVASCRRAAEKPEPAAQPPPAHQEAGAHADGSVVKVDPGMLRDLRVTTAAVELRLGGEEVTLLGELAMDERAYAEISAPVPARVARLLVNAGANVRAGQALAELSSPDLARARADYLSADARLQLAENALERKRGLAVEKIVPQREVQEADAQAAESLAALRSARAALAAFGVQPPGSEADLRDPSIFVLRSPVGGAVIEREAVVGQMLDPAAPAFKVGNLATLWLTVHAFERDAVRIASGAPARLAFSALPGQSFAGRVALVGRRVDSESRTIPVRIDVRNRGGSLRPGMSGTAAVPVGQEGAKILTVPVAAIQRVRNEWCVFLPKDASTFEIRKIGRGRDLGGEVEVLTGLRAGERIVVDGAFLLKAQAEKGEAGHGDH